MQAATSSMAQPCTITRAPESSRSAGLQQQLQRQQQQRMAADPAGRLPWLRNQQPKNSRTTATAAQDQSAFSPARGQPPAPSLHGCSADPAGSPQRPGHPSLQISARPQQQQIQQRFPPTAISDEPSTPPANPHKAEPLSMTVSVSFSPLYSFIRIYMYMCLQ